MHVLSKFDNTLNHDLKRVKNLNNMSGVVKFDFVGTVSDIRAKHLNLKTMESQNTSRYIPFDFWQDISDLSPEEQWIEMSSWCERCGISLRDSIGGVCPRCTDEIRSAILDAKKSKMPKTYQMNTHVKNNLVHSGHRLFKTELNTFDTDQVLLV